MAIFVAKAPKSAAFLRNVVPYGTSQCGSWPSQRLTSDTSKDTTSKVMGPLACSRICAIPPPHDEWRILAEKGSLRRDPANE